jgi:fluoroacetyl-CoA thioesterase
VFATPMLATLIEAAALACLAPHLAASDTSLGVRLVIDHLAPTPVGGNVTSTAELIAVDGRKLTFRAEARDDHELIGRAEHVRIVIDRARFAEKLQSKLR